MSKLTIKNDLQTELSIEHTSGSGAKLLGSQDFKYIRDTIKDLSDIVPNDGDVVLVKGYHEINDGGGGLFVYSSTEPKSNHNGGTIIDSSKTFPDDWNNQTELTDWFTGSNTTNGCWKRIFESNANIKWFGAKGDGVTDDTLCFKQCEDFITLLEYGTYLISSDITIKGIIGNYATIKLINIATINTNYIVEATLIDDNSNNHLFLQLDNYRAKVDKVKIVASNTTTESIKSVGIKLKNNNISSLSFCEVSNVYFENIYTALLFESSTDSGFNVNTFTNINCWGINNLVETDRPMYGNRFIGFGYFKDNIIKTTNTFKNNFISINIDAQEYMPQLTSSGIYDNDIVITSQASVLLDNLPDGQMFIENGKVKVKKNGIKLTLEINQEEYAQLTIHDSKPILRLKDTAGGSGESQYIYVCSADSGDDNPYIKLRGTTTANNIGGIHFDIRNDDGSYATMMSIFNNAIKLFNLPTSDPSVTGQLWNDNGTVKISAG